MEKCYYCGLPMLPRKSHMKRPECRKLIGFETGEYLSHKTVEWMRQTNEHLKRKADGGTYAKSNIVQAHAWCNMARGEKTPEEWKKECLQMVDDHTHPLKERADKLL